MKPRQVIGDPARAKVVVLPQIQDLADDVVRGGSRHSTRRPRPVAQTGVAMLDEPAPPLVERFSRNPEPTARARNIADRGGMLHDLRPPDRHPNLLCLRHRVSTLG
jgi:hypothetical protein